MIESGKLTNSSNQEDERGLTGARDTERKSNDELVAEVFHLREKLAAADEAFIRIESDNREAQAMSANLRDEVLRKKNDLIKEQKQCEALKKNLLAAETESSESEKRVAFAQKKVTELQLQTKEAESNTREHKVDFERKNKENKILEEKIHQTKQKFDLLVLENEKAAQSAIEQRKAIQLKQIEINEIKNEVEKMKKQKDMVGRKLQTVEEQKIAIEKQRDQFKREAARLEADREQAVTQNELDRKEIEKLVRDRDLLNKNLIKASGQTQKQLGLVRLHEQQKNNLEQEITQFRDEAAKQRKIIYQLEKERDRYINEASELTQKVLGNMEDVKVREMQIFDFKKKIAESETRLKQQQNLYEACRADRNLYSKNLIEAQDEITEMKRKLKIMNHQIDQLKDEISGKEAQFTKTMLDFSKTQKEKDALKGDISIMKERQKESSAQLLDMEKEIARLQVIIREADNERKRQQKELDQVITERDILGTQLVRRNDELALLYEKIKLQQATMNKGESQYTQRMEDLRVLKLEIRKLQREKVILNKSVSSVEELRNEIFHTQRELLRERTKCRALSEELENPLNIHRWRKLEGSDPASFELIQKVQSLQKRLIEKTEDIVKKEMEIQCKEKMYIELREILSRQPGPEVVEQLSEFQRALRGKTKQLKRIAAELNMSEAAQQEQDMEIHRLARELQEIKQKYLSAKKREVNRQHKDFQQVQQLHREAVAEAGPKFTGGGFNLKQHPVLA